MSELDNDINKVQEAADKLSEFFDTVQIFVTRDEPVVENGTVDFVAYRGNSITRYGQIKLWINRKEHQHLNPNED